MDLNELWIYVGELINQAIEWVGVNWTAVVATIGGTLGGGGIAVIAVQIVKTVVPILKNSNKPILTMLGDFIEKETPKIDGIITQMLAMEKKVTSLESENKTLKDYLALSAETNAKSVFLDAETKANFSAFALALKAIPNETVQKVATQVEEAIADHYITPTEALNIAAAIPIVEKALGTRIDDIIPKGV